MKNTVISKETKNQTIECLQLNLQTQTGKTK